MNKISGMKWKICHKKFVPSVLMKILTDGIWRGFFFLKWKHIKKNVVQHGYEVSCFLFHIGWNYV